MKSEEVTYIMFPKYSEIYLPLMVELARRGGHSKPSDKNKEGQTVYEALADYFELSEEARTLTISDDSNGNVRSKWNNMVRWARNDLKKFGHLDASQYGIWRLSATGKTLILEAESESSNKGVVGIATEVDLVTFRKRQEEAKRLGELGESQVIEHEQRTLNIIGRFDLSKKVRQVSIKNVAAGYDILSFDNQGNEKYIEVKASKSSYVGFELTVNELNVARKLGTAYWIYRITNVEGGMPKITQIQDPAALIEDGDLLTRATSFSVSLGETYVANTITANLSGKSWC